MSDSFISRSGNPVPSTTLVATDQVTIFGNGSGQNPLTAPGGTAGGGVRIEQAAGFDFPFGIAVTSDGAKVYACNSAGRTVAVINPATGAIVTTIPVGLNPDGVAITPDGAKAYVTNNGENTVSVIDVATDLVVATVIVGQFPEIPTILPNGTAVYVLNFGDGVTTSVSAIRTSDDTVIATIPVGDDPEFIVAAPNSAHVYVNNNGSGTVTQIQTSDNSHTAFSVANSGIAVSHDSATLYIANPGANEILFVDATSHATLHAVAVGNTPVGPIVVLPDGSQLYVFNEGDGSTSAINATTRTVATIPNAGDFFYVATPDSSKIYAAHDAGNAVIEILTASNTVNATVTLSASPGLMAATNAHVFVTTPINIEIIETATNTPEAVPPGVAFGKASTLDLSSQFLVTDEGAGVIGLAIDGTQNPAPAWAPVTFGHTNVPANLAAAQLVPIGFAADGTTFFVAMRPGSIVGLSATLTQQVTAGTLTLTASLGGEAGTLSLVLSATDHESGGSVVQAAGIDRYFRGAGIGVQITTSADFATGETPGNLYVWMETAEGLS